MKKPHAPAVRELLRAQSAGLTVKQVANALDLTPKTTLRVLMGMPDAYVDRWLLEYGSRGQYQSIWCVVVPPPNCPYPTARYEKREIKTQWVTL